MLNFLSQFALLLLHYINKLVEAYSFTAVLSQPLAMVGNVLRSLQVPWLLVLIDAFNDYL